MQPNQPHIPPPRGQNPYDFITNPSKPPKKPLIGGNPFLTKLLVIGSGILLIVIISIAISLLGRSGQGNVTALKNLVAEQEELVRVAELGASKARDSAVRATAITTQLSTDTQQQTLVHYLEEQGIKLSKEELASKRDPATDADLDAAAASNRFDDAFSAKLTELLNGYARDLQDIYGNTTNEDTKQVLSESYSSTAVLLGFKS